jgi:hypothetical protein
MFGRDELAVLFIIKASVPRMGNVKLIGVIAVVLACLCGSLPQRVLMSKSLRISDELFNQAKRDAVLSHRSPPQQVEHWAQIGRVMEDVLSYGAQKGIKTAASRESLDEALAKVETAAGIVRAKEVIARTSNPRT